MPTFSVKLDEQARAKVLLAASQRGVTPHAFMVQAIESAVTRSNEDDAWVAKALQARQNLLQTGLGVDGQAMAALHLTHFPHQGQTGSQQIDQLPVHRIYLVPEGIQLFRHVQSLLAPPAATPCHSRGNKVSLRGQ